MDNLRIFRYRTADGNFGEPELENIILHSRMYWSNPSTFNDPFDCNPRLIIGQTARDRQTYFRDVIDRNLPNLSRSEKLAKYTELRRKSPADHIRSMKTELNGWIDTSAVCCFSTINDCPLMWAHYANSHSGVCFEFKHTPDFFTFEVEYSEERIPVDLANFHSDPERGLKAILLTKSSHWRYELERRCFEYRIPAGNRSFPPEALVAVYLGARMAESKKAWMKDLCRERAHPVEVYQASIDDKKYRLNFEQA